MSIGINLLKCSSKGFTKKFDNLQECYEELDKYICSSCIITESDIKKKFPHIDFEDVNGWSEEDEDDGAWQSWYDSLPDNWRELNTFWKIERLLSTPCGCEFQIELEDN